MTEKYDFKKMEKAFYLPKSEPAAIDVPEMMFIAVDGIGDPSGSDYQEVFQILYSLAYTIKMDKTIRPSNYFEYVVPPPETFWSCYLEDRVTLLPRSEWQWRSVLRQPDFVTEELFDQTVAICRKKKPEIDTSKAQLLKFTEGLCVQIMHIGPYAEESRSMAKIEQFMDAEGFVNDINENRRHHEIYLSDPRKTVPEKVKTVLRIPVRRERKSKD